MPKKLRAVEVISDKLWITYDDRNVKSGTLSSQADLFIWLKSDGDKDELTANEVSVMFAFEGKAEQSSWHQEHVFGYPVIKIDTFNTQEIDNLPCFTKTIGSKVFFAAGHYGINFDNGGWLEAFCPKLSTLRKYEHMGPFKTDVDMQIAIQRKTRNTKDI
tara:strand:- start:89 stop:568 length:480 start_codon:yes stop_codon:yes gene_type:complete